MKTIFDQTIQIVTHINPPDAGGMSHIESLAYRGGDRISITGSYTSFRLSEQTPASLHKLITDVQAETLRTLMEYDESRRQLEKLREHVKTTSFTPTTMIVAGGTGGGGGGGGGVAIIASGDRAVDLDSPVVNASVASSVKEIKKTKACFVTGVLATKRTR